VSDEGRGKKEEETNVDMRRVLLKTLCLQAASCGRRKRRGALVARSLAGFGGIALKGTHKGREKKGGKTRVMKPDRFGEKLAYSL